MIKRKIISPKFRRHKRIKHRSPATAVVPEVGMPDDFSVPIEDAIVVATESELAHKKERREKFLKGSRTTGYIIVGLLIFAFALGAIWYFTRSEAEAPVMASSQLKISLLGAELSMVDGVVQTSIDNKTWQDGRLGDQISEGQYVRAKEYSRATIKLGDGSVLRIDNNSVAKVDILEDKTIAVTNLAGNVYTRLVESDREMSVNVADESYVSTNAAYVTRNGKDVKGAEVYGGKIKLTKSELAVPEGMYYYTETKDTNSRNKVSNIPFEKISLDKFLIWNYELDKQTEEFKKSMGFMANIDSILARQAQAEAQKKDQDAGTSDNIKLKASTYDAGINLSWTLMNMKAPKGYRVVKGTNINPVNGAGESTSISDPNITTYNWGIKDGKTYHFRVCVVDENGCEAYSNDVEVVAPNNSLPEPKGSLELVYAKGTTFNWKLSSDGIAPYGYKLVWSKVANQPYSEIKDTSKFYNASLNSGSIDATAGSYFVRVCMYKADDCVNFSNEISVIVP